MLQAAGKSKRIPAVRAHMTQPSAADEDAEYAQSSGIKVVQAELIVVDIGAGEDAAALYKLPMGL